MATTYTNPDYPHTAVITRTATTDTPPFTATTLELWSGAVDCQVSTGGRTEQREAVVVSDYTIFSACIDSQLQPGDLITVTLREGWTPIVCTIKQFSTEDIWISDGVPYGTTIWANLVRS